MNFSRSIVIPASLVFSVASASAQRDSGSTSIAARANWEISLGADPTNLNLSPYSPIRGHFVGTLTRNWQNPDTRFSRQLSLMLGADAPRYAGRPSCYGCSNKEYAGLTARHQSALVLS